MGLELEVRDHTSFHRKPRHPDATAATVAFSRCLLIIPGSIASIDSPNFTHFELGESNYEGEGKGEGQREGKWYVGVIRFVFPCSLILLIIFTRQALCCVSESTKEYIVVF